MSTKTQGLLESLYGDRAGEVDDRLEALVNRYREHVSTPDSYQPGAIPLDESDSIMIAYGDAIRDSATAQADEDDAASTGDLPSEHSPLRTLLRFLDEEAEGVVSGVHVLPFAPYSSDDGFSVIDYREVNADLGDWDDIEAIASEFTLMVDLVLNHCSAQGPWFQAFLRDEEPFNRYFITVPRNTDVSSVVRPRAHPLLTPFETDAGTKYVWTTFSADQVDLDYANPEVLLEMMDVFLGYLARGARVIRLDAIAYLWKELGTSCIHRPQAHAVVKLMRAIAEEIAPWVVIVTETNVPHEENISYFGDGTDEAHMVYNFSLPPLTLDAFLRGDATRLQDWAATLATASRRTTFFNFLASHDGIGLLPARGILDDDRIEAMISAVEERGGRISYKSTPEGDAPYEMNVNYLSAIAPASLPDAQRAAMFLASQSIMLSLAGVPGIYYHSLIGSENWEAGVEQTGHNRTINRRKLRYDELSAELNDPDTLRHQVFEAFKGFLRARAGSPAFHPSASQRILRAPPQVFAVLRGERNATGDEGDERVLCLVNVSDEEAEVSYTDGDLGLGE
ncbi:MAG: sugar phosphorylase, partial [Spirochaetota bacterium]